LSKEMLRKRSFSRLCNGSLDGLVLLTSRKLASFMTISHRNIGAPKMRTEVTTTTTMKRVEYIKSYIVT